MSKISSSFIFFLFGPEDLFLGCVSTCLLLEVVGSNVNFGFSFRLPVSSLYLIITFKICVLYCRTCLELIVVMKMMRTVRKKRTPQRLRR